MRQQNGFIKKFILFLLSFGIFGAGVLLLWASTLPIPDIKTFDERIVAQSTKIYDRTGEILLYDIHKDIQRTIVPFRDISRYMKNATVAIEDADFYKHKGIKPTAIIRAILVNIGAFGFEQGGSTITQQVVKNSLLTSEKKISRKLKEWVLSLKLEQVASKEAILELYLNEVPYGGNLYGVEEASRVFFDKSARDLTLAESAYLAALPQAPTFYSPNGNNKGKLGERKNLVLEKMRTLGFIKEEEYEKALGEIVKFQPQATFGIKAPHFVFFIREQIENIYGKDAIESNGLKIITTLDFKLQEKAEEIVSVFSEENVEKFNANNAGLVAIDPKTGQILAMVGSRDYFDTKNEGNFNVTLAHRQPGSAFKPFVYATAFMKGYTPETVVFDLKTQFHSGCDSEGKPLYENVTADECYTPVNYDGSYRGPMTLREALAQSVNIPAIKTLYLAGIKDSLETAKSLGITSLTDPNRYGLTLVLGGGEVSLLEMTSAYSVFANNGSRNPVVSILRIENSDGKIVYESKNKPEVVLPEETALQISDILKDNEARAPAFGQRSYLYFEDRDVAVKTGTTNDYKDAWIIGYTPNIAVGAWAGNNDNSPMEKRVAGFIIAPLWNAFMQEALKYLPKESFKKPKQKDSSGLKPVLRGEWKGNNSYFIDTISGKLATKYTPKETREERFVANVHSILFWVNKQDPLKDVPKFPNRDPQFSLWETSVRKWVLEQNIKEGTSTVPTKYDPVHKPEYFPIISVKNFDENKSYSTDEQIKLIVDASGRFGLSKVDLFINNRYINSTKKKPFIFSFVPGDLSVTQEKNVIKIVGYDSVFNRGEKTIKLNIKF